MRLFIRSPFFLITSSLFFILYFVTSAEAQTGPGDSPTQAELARATAARQEAEQQVNNAQTALASATAARQEAEQQLAKSQLPLGRITYRQNEDLVPYTILEQSIVAGTILDKPIPIDVTVSILDLNDVYNQLSDPKRKR